MSLAADAGGDAIVGLEARAVSLPLERPLSFSTRRVGHREYVIVTLRCADGAEGIGYTYAGTSGGRLVADAVEELIAPLVRGRPAWATRENWDLAYQELLLIGRRGLLLRALSAFDLAAWDLQGKRRDEPLARMLGSTAKDVLAYASGGYYYPRTDPLSEVERELNHYLEMGFESFKLKFGGLPLAADVARVRRARELVGPDAPIALDLNNKWRSIAEALPALDALAGLGIWWLEEPFAPDNVEGHRELAARSPIPVATGELEATRWGFAQLLEHDAAQILQPDACVIGGVGEWLDAAGGAELRNRPVAPHWHANVHAPLVAAARNGLTVEYFDHRMGVFNFERLLANPLQVAGGRIALPDEPGLGMVFDAAALERWGA